MADIIAQITNQVLVPILLAFLTALAGIAIAKINAWGTVMKARARDELVRRLIDQVTDAASAVTAGLKQEIVDDLKAAADGGKLTADQIAEIQAKALARIKLLLGRETLELLQSITPSVDDYLKQKIEEQVVQLKSLLHE